jgi:ubiquinone/menaquinone biosynthesis C-methylase UbiE
MSTVTKPTSDRSLQEISEFWSYQLNNELYVKDKDFLERGSREYFETIISAKRRYVYYLPKMIKFLKESPNLNLLEVGCGMGVENLLFSLEGFDVTGVDLAPSHIELATKLFEIYGLPSNLSVGNAEKLVFKNDSFGSALSFGVLHHTPNTEEAINEIHRVLVPGGRAVIMLYHAHSLNNFAHWLLNRGFENSKGGQDAPVTSRFSKKEVRKMCRRFKSCRIETQYVYGHGWGRIYDFTPQPIYEILSKLFGWHLVVYLEK